MIVAEVETREENASKPLQPPFRRNDIASAAAAHEASKNTREKAGSSFTPVPQLTAEELRSFKAIGRKVRRLCREKQRTAARARVEPFPPLPAPKPLPSSVQPAPALLFSAFDLVLFLDANLRAVGSEGRPQRLGWRKSYLNRKPAAQLLAPAEQVIFNRMVKRLEDKAIQSCRNTLVILDEAGGSIPCRAILGRWAAGDAAFFLALVSLKVPQRLKRLNPPVLNTPQAPRLAA
ncbi:MAG: hypothetical protein HY765_01285 [Rhodomicrobium sp.]|nr:hypothetical protein [Rhodomicrobium sp.]